MADIIDTTGNHAVLRRRLDDYAAAVSFEKGAQPKPLLSREEREDLAATEGAWGVPRGILLLVDRMMTMISPTARVNFARSLRETAPERWDQAQVVGAFIVWMLADPVNGAQTVATNRSVTTAIDAVVAVHRRALAGEAPIRADWSAARKLAITDSEPERDGRASHFAALCAEAAAWPPATSPSVGAQVLEQWSNIVGGIVDAEQDWSMADYDALQSAMKTVWDASAGDRAAGGTPDLDAMMEVENPDITVRWARHVARARDLAATRMAAACDAFVRLLEGKQI